MQLNGQPVPPAQTRFQEATVQRDRGGRIVLDSGRGNDRLHVHLNHNFGVEVKVNGHAFQFSQIEARQLTVRSGNGVNEIHVGPGLKAAGVRVIPNPKDDVEDLSGICQPEDETPDRNPKPGSRRRGAH